MSTAPAIVGVGESAVSSVSRLGALELQRGAAPAAPGDAGLTLADVDGWLTTPVRVATWAMPCGVVAQSLGLSPRYLATLDLAGSTGTAMVHHAAMAIASCRSRFRSPASTRTAAR